MSVREERRDYGLQCPLERVTLRASAQRLFRYPEYGLGPCCDLGPEGPLVEVLQYELKDAGGAGKAFVRGVKDYVAHYEAHPNLSPPEHVLVFDEAQRAYDAAMVAEKHRGTAANSAAKSEPEHFIEFTTRVPGWCVIVGLIGGGQEINRSRKSSSD